MKFAITVTLVPTSLARTIDAVAGSDLVSGRGAKVLIGMLSVLSVVVLRAAQEA